jgi:hypothetical protein
MSDLLNPGSPEPPRPPRLSPQSRRRVALVAAAAVAVIAAGVSLGLAIATTSSASSATQTGDAADEPALALPAGCDLLTPGQLAALVPGTPSRLGRGPEIVLDSTESACDWANTKTDPHDPRVEPTYLEVRATAAIDEATARSTMRISLPCTGSGSTRTSIPGADEACLGHKPAPESGGPPDVSTVSARYKALVVEVSYQRTAWPRWRVDDQAEVTAAALIGSIVQSQ